jgi:predicted AAA+ superfamily ATPase
MFQIKWVQFEILFPFDKEEKGLKYMDLLEYFSENRPDNTFFHSRKLVLPDQGSFHLIGARGVGKSTLVIEYLRSLSETNWLYIDCQDPIFALEDIDSMMLEQFVDEEGISTVVLDHYYDGFLEALPRIKRLILASRRPIAGVGLPPLELFGLDYEEFLSFERDSSPTHSFNRFLKVGTLPLSTHKDASALNSAMRQFFYASFGEDESRLMLILARFHGRRLTTHQIFTHAKEYFRISKDWIYRTIKRFQDEKLIFFIDDTEIKGARKMILYDYALSKYLSKEQSFAITFDTMIALALIKHGFDFTSLGNQGYIVKDELVIPSPFESEEQAWKHAHNHIGSYRKHSIAQVWHVTVSEHYRFELGGVVFEGIPFYEWSIVNE